MTSQIIACQLLEHNEYIRQFDGAAMTQLNLSARADHRILKLARTIADLTGIDGILSVHLAEV